MGYRSDIRIITSKKGFKKLNDYVNKYNKDNNVNYNLLDNLDVNKESSYEKYFGWDSIKWYEFCDGYEDVDAIVKGLEYLMENDYSYRFARIGENYDDYEEHYYESNSKDDEQDLEFPCMIRGFDDEYIYGLLETLDQKTVEDEVSI